MAFDLISDLEQRFLRYVRMDTESDASSDTVPSTAKQLDLLNLLAEELRGLGLCEVHLKSNAILLATIPPTDVDPAVPTIAFLAHVDTAPGFSGANVKPRVHRAWDGTPIQFPEDAGLVLDTEKSPALGRKIGQDIVTASGGTLLGADDKSGVAVLMGLARRLTEDRSVPHGRIRLCFTTDEEIGRGVDHLTPEDLDAVCAYTLDGGDTGELSSETFSADMAVIRIEGVSIHPGTALGEMVNAATLATKFVGLLPEHTRTPETTQGREGFIHLYQMEATAAEATLHFILRDFSDEGLASHGTVLRMLTETLQMAEPRARISCDISPQYRNMRIWLEKDMASVDVARQAMLDLGLTPHEEPIRGGTDGSQLTEKGVPTPNLFTGMHDLHGPLEWISLQDMVLATEVCQRIAELWTERASPSRN